MLDNPSGVIVDGQGNLYIADSGNQRVRKVNAGGTITTCAGTNGRGFGGDGGPATNATLGSPIGLALDRSGNLLIADSQNNRVRRVAANGTITPCAGNNRDGFIGDGAAATNASLGSPMGVTVDAGGDLLIADSYNNRLRRVDTNDIITTLAGNGSASFSGDGGWAAAAGLSDIGGIAVDSGGNILVADSGAGRIRRIGVSGSITTLAGNGNYGYSGDGVAATNSSLSYPVGVAINGAGEVFVADQENNRIRKIGLDGLITTVAGTNTSGFRGDGGAAASALLSGPGGLGVDAAGNLYMADSGNQRVRKLDPNGNISTVAGNGARGIYLIGTYSGDGGPATNAGFSNPVALAVDASGNLYIADAFNYRIRKVSANGVVNTYAGNGTRAFAGDGGPATNASIGLVYGLAIDSSGALLIADTSNNRTRVGNPNGLITTLAGNGTAAFAGDGGAATNASLNQPYAMIADHAGNWLIAAAGNTRLRKVSTPAAGPELALTDVSASDTGGYQLVVSGASGSVTSSVVFLTVASSPLISQSTRGANGSLALGLVGAPGSTNVVLVAPNPGQGSVWVPVATNTAGDNGDWQFADTNTARMPKKFHRSETMPPP
jgi:sugar lactone lactonase YvrE